MEEKRVMLTSVQGKVSGEVTVIQFYQAYF